MLQEDVFLLVESQLGEKPNYIFHTCGQLIQEFYSTINSATFHTVHVLEKRDPERHQKNASLHSGKIKGQ